MERETIELTIRVDPDDEELAVAVLDASGSLGSWIPSPGVVRGYYAAATDPPAAFRNNWGAFSNRPCPSLGARVLPPEDWVTRWHAGLGPVEVTPHLWIAPREIDLGRVPDDATAVVIRPGAGFGTGEHATTRALLAWLDRDRAALARSTTGVLDVGTGSGVLALAAIAIGSPRAVGLDLDRQALENAAGNRMRNDALERLLLVRGSIDAVRPDARFDRVVANLDRSTFDRLLLEIAHHVAPGGRLGVAGLLERDCGPLLDAASRAGLIMEDEARERDLSIDDTWWSAWLFRPEED